MSGARHHVLPTVAIGRRPTDLVARSARVGLAALAAVSALRYGTRHGLGDQTPAIVALTVVMLVAAHLGARSADPRPRLAWLVTVGAAWLVLVAVAPSFVWCAFPLLLLFLRTVPGAGGALATVVIAAASILALLRLSSRVDPSVVAGPIVLAGLIAATHRALSRETAAHARVIDHLTAAQQRLADQERSAGVLAERQRLAGEVHDSIAQGISSVLMLTQAAERELDHDPTAARRHLAQAVAQARHDLDEVRHIVQALAPPALDGAPLATALAALCHRQAATGIAVTFTVADDPSPTSTTQDAALLRIAQEAISNAVRHAGASRIDMTVSYLPDHVTLDVVDDGCGFDPDAPPTGPDGRRGYGLQTMAARAGQVGGHLTIESATGAGTAVSATVPAVDLPPDDGHGPGHGRSHG